MYADDLNLCSIFRGWHIDPITLKYKYMIYDDGDECKDNDRYSMTVELIPPATRNRTRSCSV